MMSNSNNYNPVHRSGFITIIGAPNAGKSTLLNRLLEEKISITSKKPQTTRNRILGILHHPHCQMVSFGERTFPFVAGSYRHAQEFDYLP